MTTLDVNDNKVENTPVMSPKFYKEEKKEQRIESLRIHPKPDSKFISRLP